MNGGLGLEGNWACKLPSQEEDHFQILLVYFGRSRDLATTWRLGIWEAHGPSGANSLIPNDR